MSAILQKYGFKNAGSVLASLRQHSQGHHKVKVEVPPQASTALPNGEDALAKALLFCSVTRFQGKRTRRHLIRETLPKVGAKRSDGWRFKQGVKEVVPGTNIPYWTENWINPQAWKKYRAKGVALRKRQSHQPTGKLRVKLLALDVGESLISEHDRKSVENLVRYLNWIRAGKWSRLALANGIRLTRIN